ncbi:hypothetical protein GCM10022397_27480 [Flavivirga jejuensis]
MFLAFILVASCSRDDDKQVSVTLITIEAETTSILKSTTLQLTATVKPENAENKGITWASSDETIATVNQEGLVTGLELGEVNITATSTADSSISGTFTLVVTGSTSNAITSFTINDVEGTINDDNTIVVTFPFGTDITALTPTIGIPEFATVSPTGAQDFSAPISYTVTAEDGSTATYTVSVTVNAPSPFITTWKTTSDNESITIYINPNITTGYDYQINWGDGSTESNLTGDATHKYASAGTYIVEISGDFPAIYSGYNNRINAEKLQTIENWGDITWKSMEKAFAYCTNLTYNATDIPNLDNVTNMASMFFVASDFNGDLSSWDVSKVTNMVAMFFGASDFNGDLSSWDVSKVTNMASMFFGASDFNGDISSWGVSEVTNMYAMFNNASSFNGDISSWDVIKVTDMASMFSNASDFNGDISSWDVSEVTNMEAMFAYASNFNGDISSWDVSNVETMHAMFYYASNFNGDISSWDVSKVTNMNFMFNNASSFNGDISSWDVSKVINMSNMFAYASNFNGDLSNWDVSNVETMRAMFNYASNFNGDLSNWDVSKVTTTYGMFNNATAFSQDLSNWATDNVTDCAIFAAGSGLTSAQLPTAGTCFQP